VPLPHAGESAQSARAHSRRERTDASGHPHGRDYARSPLVVTWEVTQACALACDHCRAEATPERNPAELSTAEARDLFEQVATFTPQPFLVLSGGDPLERFAEIGVARMALSLDGATPESHDTFRGEAGTFETAIRAAEHARELGVPIQFNTTVTAETVSELPGIADIVETYDAAMWEVFFLVPVGRGEQLQQLSPSRAREVMQWLSLRSQDAPFRPVTVEAPFYRRVARQLQDGEAGASGRAVGSTGSPTARRSLPIGSRIPKPDIARCRTRPVTNTDHPHHELEDVAFGVLTVSTSRTLADDESGDALVAAIEADGYDVVERDLVTDDREAIRAAVLALIEAGAETVVITGGTGLDPADVTVEAVEELADREIPGFGELFRMLSYEDIGPRALLSRTYAGVIDTTPVFCLPGNEQAATFGTEELVLPTIAHILGHTHGH